MKLFQIYQILGWPLRFWQTKTLPPAPTARDIPFDELMRGLKSRTDPAASALKHGMTDQEWEEKCAEMDVRYSSLKQGEFLGKLSSEELRELHLMEIGHGWCFNLTHQSKHERLGMRSIIIP